MDAAAPTVPPEQPADGTVRRAGPEDLPAILRLRAVMYDGMYGGPDGPARAGVGAAWSEATAAWLSEQLTDTAGFAAFLVDEPGRGPVSVAAGRLISWMPSPRNPAGVRGHVFNVATDADRRRQGHARRCMEALLAWFRTETPVVRIELHASAEGFELYRSLGFVLPREPALQLTVER